MKLLEMLSGHVETDKVEVTSSSSMLSYDLEHRPTPMVPTGPGAESTHLFAQTLWFPDSRWDAVRPKELARKPQNLEVGTRAIRQVVQLSRGPVRILTNDYRNAGLVQSTMIAASAEPWTPADAVAAMNVAFGELEYLNSGIFQARKIMRVLPDGSPDLKRMVQAAGSETDTMTVMAHALAPMRAEAKLKILQWMRDTYPYLLNPVLVIDPEKLRGLSAGDKPCPKQWVNGYFVFYPYVLNSRAGADLYALFKTYEVMTFPPDLSVDSVKAWIHRLAELRCSDKWLHRFFATEAAKEHNDWLCGVGRAEVVEVAPRPEAEVLREELELARTQAEAAEAARTEADTRAERLQLDLESTLEQLEMARRRTKDLLREVGDARRQLRELQLGPGELQPPVRKTSAAPAASTTPLEVPDDATALYRVPQSWDELFVCAQQLPDVYVTVEVIEEAAASIGRHRNGPKFLEYAWKAMVALQGWLDAPEGLRGTLQTFVTRHPELGITPKRVVTGEHKHVLAEDKVRQNRTFLCPDGERRLMTEGFRLTGGGQPPAPRLHHVIVDGRAYIGWIGEHRYSPMTADC